VDLALNSRREAPISLQRSCESSIGDVKSERNASCFTTSDAYNCLIALACGLPARSNSPVGALIMTCGV
jgi:hypothetical protein